MRNTLSKIFAIAIIAIGLLSTVQSNAATLKVTKQDGDGFLWLERYQTVTETKDNENNIFVTCIGDGSLTCPDREYRNILLESALSSSHTHAMLDHVDLELGNGNKSGSHTLNFTYNNSSYYRNVTWSEISTNIFEIIVVINPVP